ncbi:MAG: hypothetical protein Q8K75_09085 [Chlamydiales bacterium]|nr:hypothetical protein [Chlamydiales bacterium]
MVRKILTWSNYVLLSCVAILVFLVVVSAFKSGDNAMPEGIQLPADIPLTLAKNSFAQPEAAYNDIGAPVLTTSIVQPKLELPDLRAYLNYYGTNARPDIGAASKLLYFGLKGTEVPVGAPDGEKLYLRYDATKKPGMFVFSPENRPTNLWIIAKKDDTKANIQVGMVDENGAPVTEPIARATFVLAARDFTRAGGATWEIGKWKVDGTLLARQRARWFGQDQFLNKHGGEEFDEQEGRERIEFGEANERFVVYVKEGDCLIWDGQKWHPIQVGEASRGFPLMCVNKVDERLMRLDLWDAGGQGHVALNLVKSREAWTPKTFEQDFKFVSSRTLSQYVFEVKKDRIVLRPFDWLLLTEKGWIPLNSVEEIDGYVDRKTPGVLFVFAGPAQKEDKQVLRATLYSPSRTETFDIDFPLDQSSILGGQRMEEQQKQQQGDNKPQKDDEESSQQEESEESSQYHDDEEPSQQYDGEERPEGEEETNHLEEDKGHPEDANRQEEQEGYRPIERDEEAIKQGRGTPEEMESMHPPGQEELPEGVILAPVIPQDGDSEEQVEEVIEETPEPPVEEQLQITKANFEENRSHRPARKIRGNPELKKSARRPGRLRDDIRFLLQDNDK